MELHRRRELLKIRQSFLERYKLAKQFKDKFYTEYFAKQIIANYTPELYENSGGYYELLGTYKTKERALEVLDEIQDELIGSDFMPIEKNEEVVLTCGSAKIYEMPEN